MLSETDYFIIKLNKSILEGFEVTEEKYLQIF